jgi:prepilin-type N-terminal cleavage/methylation domain-containing protein
MRQCSDIGFTLIEIIITLLIASILGTMVFTYLNGAVTKSSQSIFWEEETQILATVMDNITADYRDALSSVTPINISSILNQYASDLDSSTVTHTQFDANGTESGSSPTIVKVIITKGDHKLMSIFTVKD